LGYLWFHTFKRHSAVDVLNVLREGPKPPAGPTTQKNEDLLGISPSCVYAYLGRMNEAFGDCAFCLPMKSLLNSGTVSPFDTGGLVDHIDPVKTWPTADKRLYLKAYSWSTSRLPILLERYPTHAPARVSAYLRAEKPPYAGFHARTRELLALPW
jgi:hypothetical protein